MPERELSPELEAAQQDALKRYEEALIATGDSETMASSDPQIAEALSNAEKELKNLGVDSDRISEVEVRARKELIRARH